MRTPTICLLAMAALLPQSQLNAQQTPPTPPTPPPLPSQTNSTSGGQSGNWQSKTRDEWMQHFSEALNLTPDQKSRVEDIFDEWHQTMLEAKTNAQTQLEQVLTPEQYQKFESMFSHKGHHGRWHHGGDTNEDSGDNHDEGTQGGPNQNTQ